MLIFTRKVGEAFYIGDDIEVCVLEVLGDKVRIGIEAPREIIIARKELRDTEQENKSAIKKVNISDLDKINKLLKKAEGSE